MQKTVTIATQPHHLRETPNHMANVLPDKARRTIYLELFKHSEMMLTGGNVIANMSPIHCSSSDFCLLFIPVIYTSYTISQYHQQHLRSTLFIYNNLQTYRRLTLKTNFCCTSKNTHKRAHSSSFKVPDGPNHCVHVIYSFLSNFAIRSNVAEPSRDTGSVPMRRQLPLHLSLS